MDGKLRSLDTKLAEIRDLTGVVDTLSKAEEIRREADAYKESVDSGCAGLREAAAAEMADAQHRIDDLLNQAKANRDETTRLLDEAKSAHDAREAEIAEGERVNYQRNEALTNRENLIMEKEQEIERKLAKLNAALGA